MTIDMAFSASFLDWIFKVFDVDGGGSIGKDSFNFMPFNLKD